MISAGVFIVCSLCLFVLVYWAVRLEQTVDDWALGIGVLAGGILVFVPLLSAFGVPLTLGNLPTRLNGGIMELLDFIYTNWQLTIVFALVVKVLFFKSKKSK